jgi:hypothetical protein
MSQLRIILLSFLLLTTCLSGCTSEEDDTEEKPPKPKFSWPEQVEAGCDASASNVLKCTPYYDVENESEHAVLTLRHPISDSLWVVSLDGHILILENGDDYPKLVGKAGDLSSIVSRCHYEQGLLGMAFDQDFINTSMILLVYNEDKTCESKKDSNIILAHAKVENNLINLDTVETLVEVNKSNRNHNGGHILPIGNHQYLWSIGDGGGSFDPNGNGQNKSNILGTIQLINYRDGELLSVDNDSSNNTQTLHHGLRNSWRFDVDPSGNLWIADVGQNCFEEINMVPVFQSSNFGWSEREGFHELDREGGCDSEIAEENPEFTDPIIEYSHEEGDCSVTGGYWMDWGPDSLRDGYLYGDFCTGNIWLIQNSDEEWVSQHIVQLETMIVGFGRGINDELLIFSWAGTIYQLDDI